MERSCQEVLNVAQSLYSVHPQLSCTQLMRSIETWQLPIAHPPAMNSNEEESMWTVPIHLQHKKPQNHRYLVEETAWHHSILYKLAQKLNSGRAANGKLNVLILGGSMTAGREIEGLKPCWNKAWPAKAEAILKQLWNQPNIRFINIALGGSDEAYWLSHMHRIVHKLPVDIILVESAVNDYSNYKDREEKAVTVNQTSYQLLNRLVHLPCKPVVLSVELFRLLGVQATKAPMPSKYCPYQTMMVSDSSKLVYCPQFWYPQTWREEARSFNQV